MWTPRNLALAAVSAVSTFSSLAAAAAAADSVPFTVPTAFHSSRIIPPIHYAHTPPQTGSSSGLSTFVGVRGASSLELGNAGPYILDENGDVVWYGGTKSVLNFGSHTYKGEPVLAFYTGSEEFPGYGHGQWQLYNSSYDLITTVESKGTGAANSTDPHDFTITPDDTAIIEDWRPRQVDLRSLGGAEDGWAFDCIVQEVNIETGELVWQWSSLDHVPVSETFYEVIGGAGTMEQPFDSHHLNSVQRDTSGNFIISMRGPSTVYYVDRETGNILWRIGRWDSDYPMNEETIFHFQHHARLHGSGLDNPARLSLFSNGANQYQQTAVYARAIVLNLDTEKKTVTLEQQHYPTFLGISSSEGSVQVLENGNVFVGWGINPWYTEFAPNGTKLHDVQFGGVPDVERGSSDHSYRVFKAPWSGFPRTLPSFVLDNTTFPASAAFVSWNGATSVASYRLLLGATPSDLHGHPDRIPRTGFETRLELPWQKLMTDEGVERVAIASYVAVVAYDKDGTALAGSEVLETMTGEATGAYADVEALWWRDQRRTIQGGTVLSLALLIVAVFGYRRGYFSSRNGGNGYAPVHNVYESSRSKDGFVLPLAATKQA